MVTPVLDAAPPVAAAGTASVAVRPGATEARDRRRPRLWVLVTGLLLLAAALTVTAATVDVDSGSDVLGLARSVGHDVVRLRWQFVAVVAALGACHYVATALAARAASGLRLPLTETLLVQLAAAAANRLTPAGLGGSALTARYFSKRGLDMPAAVGAVSALAVLGAVADLLVLVALVVVGGWLGLGSGRHELGALTAHIRRLLGPVRSPVLWLVVAVLAAGLALGLLVRRRRGRASATGFWRPLRGLLARPAALTTLLASSGVTTLVLGLAFVASIAMVPGPHPTAGIGAVLVAFMLGAAAGSTVPIPAGLGSTEGALIAVLVGLGEPAAHAVQVVMVFRLITFWTPAAVGVIATRHLYRRAAI